MDDLVFVNMICFDVVNGMCFLSLYGCVVLLNVLLGFLEILFLVLSVTQLKAYLLRNFFSAEECDYLMKLVKRELVLLIVVGEVGDLVFLDICMSVGMFLRKG